METYDLFAEALWHYYRTGRASIYIERDDGYRRREDMSWYFTSYGEFPSFEKQALRHAKGNVLDIGCGAGRHSLYLQRRGLTVIGIDTSQLVVELARTRGVKDARVVDACSRMPFRDGEFDTVVLFGNNLGICGSMAKFGQMLQELRRITSPQGIILGTTRMPDAVDPRHLSYLRSNVVAGRDAGQLRVRLVSNHTCGEWFDLLLLAPTDLLEVAAKEGWELERAYGKNVEEGYAVVMQKV